MNEVTAILSRIGQGDRSAAEELLPLLYDELRKLAASRMAKENPSHTLQATALVHEAYLRLVQSDGEQRWESRGHFFAAAAEAMRRILIEEARRKNAVKRGGGLQRVDFDENVGVPNGPSVNPQMDLIALDEALTQLEKIDPKKAALVKLRYFSGLSVEESALALEISEATAKRYWVYARSWLFGQLRTN